MPWVTSGHGSDYSAGSAASFPTSAFVAAAGGSILVAVRFFNYHIVTVTGVTDTAGNTYTFIGNAPNTFEGIELWYATNILGHAANVVTATVSSTTNFWGIVADHYSDVVTLDGSVNADGTFATTVTSDPFNAQPGIIYAAAQVSFAGGTWTADANYVKRTEDASAVIMTEDRFPLVALTGETASATSTSGNGKSLVVAYFTAVSSPGPGPGPGPAPSTGTGLLIQMCFGGSYRSYLRNRP